jgi:DnaJ-class molecular chaperone
MGGEKQMTCPTCDGAGWTVVQTGMGSRQHICSQCGGTGTVDSIEQTDD